VHVESRLDADLPLVFVDGARIGRVLLNLLGNALRYTPAGGAVTVLARRRNGELQLSVQDSGTGVAAGDLPHIFESFYRGEKSRSRQHGGAGLGLAIARGLVEAHGGRMWAESEPGGGTTVSFTLPDSGDIAGATGAAM
jgi:signal transduction histidine kinase